MPRLQIPFSFLPCEVTSTRVPGIRRWASLGGSYYSACHSALCTVLEAAGEKQTFQNQTGLKLNCFSATCWPHNFRQRAELLGTSFRRHKTTAIIHYPPCDSHLTINYTSLSLIFCKAFFLQLMVWVFLNIFLFVCFPNKGSDGEHALELSGLSCSLPAAM